MEMQFLHSAPGSFTQYPLATATHWVTCLLVGDTVWLTLGPHLPVWFHLLSSPELCQRSKKELGIVPTCFSSLVFLRVSQDAERVFIQSED